LAIHIPLLQSTPTPAFQHAHTLNTTTAPPAHANLAIPLVIIVMAEQVLTALNVLLENFTMELTASVAILLVQFAMVLQALNAIIACHLIIT